MDNQDATKQTEQQLIETLKEADKALDAAKKVKDEANQAKDEASNAATVQETKDSGKVALLKLDTRVENFDELKFPPFPKAFEVSNFPDFPKTIIPPFPKTIAIENWAEMPMPPAPQRFPDSIQIKKPAWLPLLFAPFRPLQDTLNEISLKLDKTEEPAEIKFPTKDKDALPVRVINFPEQVIGGGFSGGSGSGMPKVDVGGTMYGLVTSGIKLPTYDYVAMVIAPAGTETWTFKENNSQVAKIVIVYTDATRTDISTVTRS